jgi:hypothetical protein
VIAWEWRVLREARGRRIPRGIIRREMMKRLLFAGTMFAALMITIGAFTAQANTEPKKNDRATVQFTETVKLLNVFLKGEYLVVHDEDRMAKGEDCTYVYDKSGKLIVSFHCTPVERKKAEGFRIVTARLDPSGVNEVKEIQFAGTTEAHLVP